MCELFIGYVKVLSTSSASTRCCNSASIAKIMEKGYSATLDDYNSVVKGEFEINLMVNS